MTLAKRERLLLSTLQLQGDLTAAELATKTGLKVHNVHYMLRQFKERKLIRRWVFLDMFALGFEEVEVYFSLASATPHVRSSFIKLLKEDPHIIWFATLGGDFQYAMTICARSTGEAASFLDGLAKKFGNVMCKKSIASLLEFHILPKKYLIQGIKKAPDDSVVMAMGRPKAELDETDWTIIAELNNPTNESAYDLSRATGIARATVEYRLKKLKEKGVIQRVIHFIDAKQLGMQIFKILIFARGVTSGFSEGISKLVKDLPHVVNMTRTFGGWDYELGVEAPDPEVATATVEVLYEKFGAIIQDIQILPVFSQSNSSQFLRVYNRNKRQIA